MMTSGDTGGRNADVDVNLAPIIDCFTVLIIFLLASASFLSVGILDTTAAIPGPQTPVTQGPPGTTIEVEITPQHAAKIHVTGKVKLDRTVPAKNGEINAADLTRELAAVQSQTPETKGLILKGEDEAPYLDVVRVMDLARPKFPAIALGGFK